MLARALILRTAAMGPVERAVRGSRLFRPLVSRFIAGDDLESAVRVASGLLASGMRVSLDYLGENTRTLDESAAATATYVGMLERIARMPEAAQFSAGQGGEVEPVNISIKLTQCGLDLGDEVAEAHLRQVLRRAAELRNFVRVDMESSAYTERTLAMIERIRPEFANTGTVLQSYLYRTDEDVERMIRIGARTRLVKGAYLEPASVAHPEKAKVDEAYVRQAKRLLEAAPYPALATHDALIVRQIEAFVAERSIPPERFEFQMLYGIRRDLQERLRADGFNVRVYVPFGDQWYPYFTRRLAERPANAMFILRSLFRG